MDRSPRQREGRQWSWYERPGVGVYSIHSQLTIQLNISTEPSVEIHVDQPVEIQLN